MEKNEKVTFTFLKELNEDIKSGDIKKQNAAYATLESIELRGLNAGLIMYVHYLNFKRNENLTSIEDATACYLKVFQTACWYRVRAKNPKYYFKYAESLHLLSQYVFCLFEQNELHNKAYLIAIYSGRNFPESKSLKWLQHHILKS